MMYRRSPELFRRVTPRPTRSGNKGTLCLLERYMILEIVVKEKIGHMLARRREQLVGARWGADLVWK
jgi:hypothetical protein